MSNCHCCGTKYKDHAFKIFKCPKCGHFFRAFPNIDPSEYYNEEYRKGHPVFPHKERFTYASNLANAVLPYLKDCKSILEVGAGDGVLSKVLMDNKKDMFLCEIDKGLSVHLDKLGVPVHYDSFVDLSDEIKPDAILAADVLEHFYDPIDFKKKAEALGAKKLALQVPVKRDIKVVNIKKFDGHYHCFNEESFKELFAPEWKAIFVKETPWNFTARKTAMIVVLEKIDGGK